MQLRSDPGERYFSYLNPIGNRKHNCRMCKALLTNGSCMLGYRNSSKSTRLIETSHHIKPTEPCPKPVQVKSLMAELCFQVLYRARRVTSTDGAMAKEEPIHLTTVLVKTKRIGIDGDESNYIADLIEKDAERIPTKNGILYNRLIDLAGRFRPQEVKNLNNNILLGHQVSPKD